ncbi:C_GCAxxG_C_C family protein [Candidatus Thorarchaeota archaeon]|nr:MAG: C_GCAxxG_C_C family protein [Candidatus Thorarchaeota archaeon]
MIMIEDSVKRSREFFQEDYNCAQSVLKSVLIALNLDFEKAVQLTAGFGGGMAHEGQVCGAVSGAIAALGVIKGQHAQDIQKHKQATYETAETFVRNFKERHKTIICDDLTGIKMKDKLARDKALRDGVFSLKCSEYVTSAVQLVLEIVGKQ